MRGPRRRCRASLATLGLAATILAGCGADAASPEPIPVVTETPDRVTLDAIRFRMDLGLRADLPFVRAVADDPAAVLDYGVPLLPAEVREIERRGAASEAIVPVVRSYAAEHPEDYGGLYIDQQRGGAVTVLWTANVEEHATALVDRLAGIGPVVIRHVAHTETALDDLSRRLGSDRDWLAEIPAALQAIETDVIANRVTMYVSSRNPAVADLIWARYGVGPDVLAVVSDGTGVALEPWGTIHGLVVDVPAAVLAELTLSYRSDRPGAGCGMGDVGFGIAPDGTFELPCQGGHWTIEASRTIDDVVARGEVDLAPGGTATMTLHPIAP